MDHKEQVTTTEAVPHESESSDHVDRETKETIEERVSNDVTKFTSGLVPLEPRTLTEAQSVAAIFAQSGLFKDVHDMSRAFVKIMAGREMGFGAFASMNGIHIIDGKPCVGAGLMAAAVKRSGQYTYHIKTLTNRECEIEFFDTGKLVGTSTFTMDDAEKAFLVKDRSGWVKNPRNMLFARAMSNGQRWFCPDVFSQPVYTPEEMGADVDEDGNMIIEGEFEYQPTDTRSGPGKPIANERRMDTRPNEPAKPNGQSHTHRPLPDSTPWSDVIKDWDAKNWATYWKEMAGAGLNSKEVHEALGVSSAKEFPGTRGEHNRAIVNASRVKRGLEPLEDTAPQEPATPEPPAKPKGQPFHMPTAPKTETPAITEPAPSGKVSMVNGSGYLMASRVIVTSKPGSKPTVTVYGMDDSFREDPIPAISQQMPTATMRALFGDLIPKTISPDGTLIYTYAGGDADPMSIEWTRENGEAEIADVLIV